jgi:hypothetical protein
MIHDVSEGLLGDPQGVDWADGKGSSQETGRLNGGACPSRLERAVRNLGESF